jgi:hypothetical protein
LARATGEILCWLNSDDCLEPGALREVARHFANGADAINGCCLRVEPDGATELLRSGPAAHWDLLRYWRAYPMHQPSVFWRRDVTRKVGVLDESQHLAMDYEYWLRMARHFAFLPVDTVLSRAQAHPAAKTGGGYDRYLHERRRLAWREARARGMLGRFARAFLHEALGQEFDALLRPVWPRRWKGLRKRLRGTRP